MATASLHARKWVHDAARELESLALSHFQTLRKFSPDDLLIFPLGIELELCRLLLYGKEDESLQHHYVVALTMLETSTPCT